MATIIIILFIAGYVSITLETAIKINKAATALITGVLCWTIYILFASDRPLVVEQLTHHLGNLSQILFFLMGAMTIVEVIDAHDGFEIITQRIKTTDKRKLLWIIGIISFFLSAVLDNLTTTIVMLSIVRKMVTDKNDRWLLAGIVIIAANSGGAWSPIGDVTSTMLWIGGQVTAGVLMYKLVIPCIVCLTVPLFLMQFLLKGKIEKPPANIDIVAISSERNIILVTGIGVLIMVPVFKAITHLPPFMGMLIGLGIVWMVSEIIHREKEEEERQRFTVSYVLRKVDTSSILFFLGILLAIAALESVGQLKNASGWMNRSLKDENIIAISIGLLSSVIDNVPLVAAAQGMYDINAYPANHHIWEFLAYSAGTGGSILIIGSASGIAAMGLERINFFWYLRRIGWIALAGYFAGAAIYILEERFL